MQLPCRRDKRRMGAALAGIGLRERRDDEVLLHPADRRSAAASTRTRCHLLAEFHRTTRARPTIAIRIAVLESIHIVRPVARDLIQPKVSTSPPPARLRALM